MGEKHPPYTKEQCSLKADIINHFPEHHVPFDVFSAVTNLDGLVIFLVDESNLYNKQNGREFLTIEQEMKSFSGINYIMSINKLSTVKSYWECGRFIANEGMRNVTARSRFEDILRNLQIFGQHKR